MPTSTFRQKWRQLLTMRMLHLPCSGTRPSLLSGDFKPSEIFKRPKFLQCIIKFSLLVKTLLYMRNGLIEFVLFSPRYTSKTVRVQYKWIPGELILGVTLDGLTCHPGVVEVLPAASCYTNWDKLRTDEQIGSYAD